MTSGVSPFIKLEIFEDLLMLRFGAGVCGLKVTLSLVLSFAEAVFSIFPEAVSEIVPSIFIITEPPAGILTVPLRIFPEIETPATFPTISGLVIASGIVSLILTPVASIVPLLLTVIV